MFYCEIFDIMIYDMHERKSYTLPHLCVQYQLPYGMVGKIPAEDIKCGGQGISAGTGAGDCRR